MVHDFPADGEYVFNIRDFLFMGAGYVTKVDDRQRVILTIDDVRVFQQEFGGPEDLKAVDQRQSAAADEMQSRFNGIRVRVKAGPHRVGVAFIQRTFAESDSPLQPMAMLPEMERVPTIPGLRYLRTLQCHRHQRNRQPAAHLHLPAGQRCGRIALRAANTDEPCFRRPFAGRPPTRTSRRLSRSTRWGAKPETSKRASKVA